MRAHRTFLTLVTLLAAAAASPAWAQSSYTTLDLEACEVLKVYEEGGGADLRCDGHGGFDVACRSAAGNYYRDRPVHP